MRRAIWIFIYFPPLHSYIYNSAEPSSREQRNAPFLPPYLCHFFLFLVQADFRRPLSAIPPAVLSRLCCSHLCFSRSQLVSPGILPGALAGATTATSMRPPLPCLKVRSLCLRLFVFHCVVPTASCQCVYVRICVQGNSVILSSFGLNVVWSSCASSKASSASSAV